MPRHMPARQAVNSPPPGGFIASYLLVGIALISVVALALNRMTDDQSERRLVTEVQRAVLRQAELIRAQGLCCTNRLLRSDGVAGSR